MDCNGWENAKNVARRQVTNIADTFTDPGWINLTKDLTF
jgi:hypothetical protein